MPRMDYRSWGDVAALPCRLGAELLKALDIAQGSRPSCTIGSRCPTHRWLANHGRYALLGIASCRHSPALLLPPVRDVDVT